MNNDRKHKVHNLIILDESGSMMSIKKSIIRGFNELVHTIKGLEKAFPEQEHLISFVTFNGLGQKFIHFAEPVSQLEMIDDRRYQPDSLTPLFDAMGSSFGKLGKILENETDYHVLVTILTDGEENDSREFTGLAIKNQIEELKFKNWTFTYIGTDHDVEEFAVSISIQNSMKFDRNDADICRMFATEKEARISYFKKIRDNKVTSGDFYKNSEEKKE
jgi:Mg-chelatase subunit ChlD